MLTRRQFLRSSVAVAATAAVLPATLPAEPPSRPTTRGEWERHWREVARLVQPSGGIERRKSIFDTPDVEWFNLRGPA